MIASIPFLVVRLTYSCLAAFDTYHGDRHTLTWSPLYGSIAALVIMHSLMEYIVVVIYVLTGITIPPVRTGKARSYTSEQVQAFDAEYPAGITHQQDAKSTA